MAGSIKGSWRPLWTAIPTGLPPGQQLLPLSRDEMLPPGRSPAGQAGRGGSGAPGPGISLETPSLLPDSRHPRSRTEAHLPHLVL